jgi:lactate permease
VPVLLSLAPVLLILGLMVGLRWPAAWAGLAGVAATAAIAAAGFDFGTDGWAAAYGGAFAEATFVAATVAWIVFPALCIFELQLSGGAFDTIRTALARLSADPRILVLLVAWFFALFMEGAAGFGTPVALAAPMLVGLGYPPVQAVTLAMIGHAAGVSFGAIGTPVLPQIAQTGLTALEISRATGMLHACLAWILLLALVRLARPETGPGGGTGIGGWALAAGACFLAPFLVLAWGVGPELPTLAGALVGGLAFVGLLRWRHGHRPAAAVPAEGALLRAAWPYLVLLALILATRLVPPLQDGLRGLAIAWSLPGGFAGSVAPLYHPGTMLMLGFLLGGWLQGRRGADLSAAAGRAARRLPLVLVALVAMLGVARLMVHSGMIGVLAEAAAAGVGPVWPLLSPAVGVLGTFVTGSATASNILLTEFQQQAAARLDLPARWMVAAQGFGAAVGNIVCPHNVIAGGATVGIAGREGEVLRRTTPASIAYALAGGALVWLIVTALV